MRWHHNTDAMCVGDECRPGHDEKALYTVHPEQRENVLVRLCGELEGESSVRGAYVYGSVLGSDRVHDVDVGIFLDETAVTKKVVIVDALSVKLTGAVALPVDLRVPNEAPISFHYHVLRGRLLLCRDEPFLTDMLENVARRYLNLLRSSAVA
jgi:uncharacterized protein